MAQTKYKLVITALDKTKAAFAGVTKALGKIGNAAKGIGKVLGGLGLAVAAVATAFVAMGKKAFDALDSIGKTASRTGFAAESLQALRLGAVESGSSVEALNKAIEKFSKNIGDVIVKGTGEATYALDRMGISLYDSAGALKDNDTILREVSDGIKNMASETEKNSALQGLFGRQGILMNQVFGEGAEAIDRWIVKAKEMGFVVSGTSIKAVEAFNDRFAELKFMLDGLVKQTFAALAPGLEKVITGFKDWAVESQKAGTNLEDLGKIIAETLVEALARFVEAIGIAGQGLDQFFNKIGNFFKWLKAALQASVRDFEGMKETIDGIKPPELSTFAAEMEVVANKIRLLMQPLEDLNDEIDTTGDEVEKVIKLFPELDDVLTGFGTGFESIFKNSETTLTKFSDLGKKVGKTLEDGLTDAFMNIGRGAEGLKDTMDQILKAIVRELISVFVVQKVVGAVTSKFGGAAAEGGPVSGGTSYLVGEKGPELFTPGRSGVITPNNQLATASASTNVNVTFDIKSWDSRDTLEAISQQAPAIVGIVEQSFRKRGRRGPLGP